MTLRRVWRAVALVIVLAWIVWHFWWMRLCGRMTLVRRAAWLLDASQRVLRCLGVEVKVEGTPPTSGLVVSMALFESFAIALLYMLALLGAVFMFSSMFKNSLYAVLVVAVLFLFGFSIIGDLVSTLVKIEPRFLITYAQNVISYPFLSTLPAHVVVVKPPRGGGSITTYNPTYAEGFAVMGGYFILTAIAGLFLFEREEFT